MSLGYDFPVEKWGKWIKGLNVSVVGNNLAMLFLRAPFDPEMTSNVGTYNQGVDYFMQPSTRSLGFSVKVKFGGSTASKAPASVPNYVEPYVPEKVVEKVVEKEVIKEVPVEVIKEVKVPAKLEGTYEDDLYFIIGKTEIRPEQAFKLGQIAQILKENPDATITISGYADSATGNASINQTLSEQRAAKVKEMLMAAGISESRISIHATGSDRNASQSPESNRVAVCIVK